MNRHEAAGVLGVAPDADPDTARAAYRALIGRHHPDRAGAGANAAAARINQAYDVLARPQESAVPPVPPSWPPPDPAHRQPGDRPWAGTATSIADGDTLVVGLPPDEAFLLLLDAAHDVGDVTFVDPDNGLLEVLVQFEETPVCSLMVTLQGRAEHTDAFCTLEALDDRTAPPVADVVPLLLDEVRRRTAP